MEPDLSQQAAARRAGRGYRAVMGQMLPGLAICAFGGVMWVLAQGQPAWLRGQFGPGLMAQLLAMGVIGLGAAWALLCSRNPDRRALPTGCGSGTDTPMPGLRHSAPALLGAVLAFALSLPLAGLVLAGGLAAGLSAWGAGERKLRALVLTVAGLMALVALVGVLLLPPTAPLWPDI